MSTPADRARRLIEDYYAAFNRGDVQALWFAPDARTAQDLLDQVPDRKVPIERLDLPPLQGKPGTERFGGPVKPIKEKY